MEKKDAYECEGCGKTANIGSDNLSDCCGKPVKKLEDVDVCTTVDTAEHSRLDGGDACDDGRAG